MVWGLNKDRMEKWTPAHRLINHTCIFHVGLVPQSHWIQWECVRLLVDRCEKSICGQLVACFAAVTSQTWLATHVMCLSFLHLWHESRSNRKYATPTIKRQNVGDFFLWPEHITNTMEDCLLESVVPLHSRKYLPIAVLVAVVCILLLIIKTTK